MAQLSPSSLYYAQAMALLNEFMEDFKKGNYKSIDEVSAKIESIVNEFEAKAGGPLMTYERIVQGEPPISAKMNRTWKRIQDDMNIMQDQVMLVKAGAIFLYNYMATEVLNAQRQNALASNKMKTLQLYSSAKSSNVIIFGDYFKDDSQIDYTKINPTQRAIVAAPGVVTLGKDPNTTDVLKNAVVKVLSDSNGFLGNNQEVSNKATAPTNPIDGSKLYTFKAQVDRRADLKTIKDANPTTWLEYEVYEVSQADRAKAKGFNFVYRDDIGTISSENQGPVTTEGSSTLLDWSRGPTSRKNLPGGPAGGGQGQLRDRDVRSQELEDADADRGLKVLKLFLEFDLQQVRTINTISLLPFMLEDNKNYPLLIKLIQTSKNGTDWERLNPEDIWVAGAANLESARLADNLSIGSGLWSFGAREAQYVRIEINQPNYIPVDIGHLYYESQKTVVTSTTIDIVGDNSAIEPTYTIVGGERIEGPIPPLSKPDKYYNQTNSTINNTVQKIEVFDGKRWVIGLRDINIEEVKYKPFSVLVSKPFRIDGIVDRVALESDTSIPESFSNEDVWIRYYVSPDEGENWFPIARIQDDFFGLPEILAFNDPTPAEFQETGVSYHSVKRAIDSVRLKVELYRPSESQGSTPELFNYRLKVSKRT